MNRTRTVFFAIIGIAVVIVAIGAFVSGGINLGPVRATEVTGLVGSEKVPFFSDERVQEELRQNGLNVTVQKAGSREIATSFDLSEYDFVFPAGVPSAEKIKREHGISKTYDPFFTPMTIATWEPIADLLKENGVADDSQGYYTIDMGKLIELMDSETRWNELPNNTAFPVNKSILVTSTDVRKSNSAAMYLSLASYEINNKNIVQNMNDASPFLSDLSGLFLRQGLRPDSSQEPFEDYLVKGMGHSPLVMIYEAQFIAQARLQPASILDDMVLMYPAPTIFTKHTLLPITDGGTQLGELLETNPTLQELAIEYGLRNNNLAYFKEVTSQINVSMPDQILDVVEPPSYEVLEGIIREIESDYLSLGASDIDSKLASVKLADGQPMSLGSE